MALSIDGTGHGLCPRTHVLRGDNDGSPWELWQRTPHPALGNLVLELWAGFMSSHARHRVLPNGEASLMFHLGAPQRLTEHAGAASDEVLHMGFVSGLQEAPSTFDTVSRETRVVAARLTPLGVWQLLGGLPQAQLACRVIDVDAVFERRAGVRDLYQRMCSAADLGLTLGELERWLLERLQSPPRPHPATRQATRLLHGMHGSLPAATLARECGVSQRRLRELLLRETGMSTKRLARVIRFRHAIGCLARDPETDLGQLALACGYYDQPHMNREFRALATMTPVGYLASRGDGLDGPDVIGG